MIGNRTQIEQIIRHFGGQNAMARALGCRQGTIWAWIKKGEIPSGRIKEVIAAARKLEPAVDLTPNDFFEPTAALPAPCSQSEAA
jgi:hypothetical protein